MEEIKFNYDVFRYIFDEADKRIKNSEAMNNIINQLANDFGINPVIVTELIKTGYKCALVDTDAVIHTYDTKANQ